MTEKTRKQALNPGQKAVLVMILLYKRVLSPIMGHSCRFSPTCSTYATEAITRHGTMRGGWLALKRIGKCHPWHQGGHDPVP